MHKLGRNAGPNDPKPARKSPPPPEQPRREPGHSGIGTDSALRRLKNWERSRAALRGDDTLKGPGR